MRKPLQALGLAGALLLGTTLASALYAQGSPSSDAQSGAAPKSGDNSRGDSGANSGRDMMGPGMMNGGGMRDMMGMMRRMSRMMDECDSMMRDSRDESRHHRQDD